MQMSMRKIAMNKAADEITMPDSAENREAVIQRIEDIKLALAEAERARPASTWQRHYREDITWLLNSYIRIEHELDAALGHIERHREPAPLTRGDVETLVSELGGSVIWSEIPGREIVTAADMRDHGRSIVSYRNGR
jgi:hypothetical protein